MKDLTEYSITRFKKGTTPNDGEVIYSRVFHREEFDLKKKAIDRLYEYAQASEKNIVKFITIGFEITRVDKDAEFNNAGENIYKEHTAKRILAATRLARYMSKKDNTYVYFCKPIIEEHGEFYITSGQRNTKSFNNEDKLKTIKKQISARKAVVTRAINKAKKVRAKYESTLFADGYKDDPKFVKLISSISVKKERLRKAKSLTVDDMEDVLGGIKEQSLKSYRKLEAEAA